MGEQTKTETNYAHYMYVKYFRFLNKYVLRVAKGSSPGIPTKSPSDERYLTSELKVLPCESTRIKGKI